jgi:hypothetical protein
MLYLMTKHAWSLWSLVPFFQLFLIQEDKNYCTVKPLFTYSIGRNGCTYCKKYLNRDMDFHRHVWSGLIGQWPSQKIAKICNKALRLTCKLSSFHLHLFQFSHTDLWILFFQTLNNNHGRVITPAFPKSWKLWTISILMNRVPKVPM